MIVITLLTTLFAGLIGLCLFVYYLRKGQFDDTEEVKYQLFHEEEE